MKEIIMKASELVVNRGGDVTTDDGEFATVEVSDVIELEMSIANCFELGTDDVKRKDLPSMESALNYHLSQIEQLTKELEAEKVRTKKAFWWSAEFTHTCFSGKIQQAWNDFKKNASS